eukprot:TRINITY_DN5220_c0_g1_i1.p1 TRINITY_DN5220_c0_g1~~TRINITY_DN5220_c0_g1_i1.p1  ORF type:complete len:1077 (+),score=219.69 TRINITY_DN5220_c0_g1_i1:18-3248(+)
MEGILNFDAPLDVNLLDRVVNVVYNTQNEQERNQAQKVLERFKSHDGAWTRVDTILEHSQSDYTKFFATQVLDSLIKTRWKVLPADQRSGIKNYAVSLVLKLTKDPQTFKKHATLISRIDVAIVQILKVDWPHHWKNFIPEIVEASKQNENVCSNCMTILGMLSEEIFDFSEGKMTRSKIKELKETLTEEFYPIFQLCLFVMNASKNGNLLLTTLDTLDKYLSWIPIGYIFETDIVKLLITKFLSVREFRNSTLKCLTQIASLEVPGAAVSQKFESLYLGTLQRVVQILPPNTDMQLTYRREKEPEQNFINDLALFLSAFFVKHRSCLEKNEHIPALLTGHQYLVNISTVDEIEVFKVCVEYWNSLAESLYEENPVQASALMLNSATTTPRRQLYGPLLSRVRTILISRMAKPEEVLVVEDEDGEHAIRQRLPDGEAVERYQLMQSTLVYLTHLNYEDTESIMLSKLAAQRDGSQWSWHNLNTLCWAIGSIAESLPEHIERKFVVVVIKDLLILCRERTGKDNKAIVASNIMYVVGQYPRFLKAHWRFLVTVLLKLFEFMHELHPGVQDMAVDTILKIVTKCKSQFGKEQNGDETWTTKEVIGKLPSHISDLSEEPQVQTFYEGVGVLVSAHPPRLQGKLVVKLMELPNNTWRGLMQRAAQNTNNLADPAVQRSFANILRVNNRACMGVGPAYIHQFANIYLDALNLCKFYSEQISKQISQNSQATGWVNVKQMRAVKREVLRLVTTFISCSDEVQTIVKDFLPPLLPAVLQDYSRSVPQARDHEVLRLMAEIVSTCKGLVVDSVPIMFDCLFESTLSMITKNFEDFPDIRVNFYLFLRQINNHCFQAFVRMNPQQFKLVIQSVVWGFKHWDKKISETTLKILLEMFTQFSRNAQSDPSKSFYGNHLLPLLEDILFVLTDTFHKADFKLHCEVLIQIIYAVEADLVTTPLFNPQTQTDSNMNNRLFLRQYVSKLLLRPFGNVNPEHIHNFVLGLFDLNKEMVQFHNHLRDFLVQIKQYSAGDDNAVMYEREEAASRSAKAMAIPGMVQPHDPRRGDGRQLTTSRSDSGNSSSMMTA